MMLAALYHLAANTILCNLGVRTEYEFEREMLRCGVWHYDQA